MEYSVRKAIKSDAERINELFIEMLNTIYNTDEAKGYDEGYLDKFFANREDQILLAECGKEVVAFLSVEVYREEGYIYLDDLSVTGKCRNLGVGTRLIRLAEEYAKEIGVPVIVFHVEKKNSEAHRLYKRLGYSDNEEQGTRIRMVKELELIDNL